MADKGLNDGTPDAAPDHTDTDNTMDSPGADPVPVPAPAPASAPSATTQSANATTETTTSSSSCSSPPPPALLEKILSRVKMLGRSRSSRGAAAPASSDPGGSWGAAPAPGREAEPELLPGGAAPETCAASAASTYVDVVASAAREASDSDSVISTASSGYIFTDPSESGTKFKVKDLGPFCEQIDRLLDYIHSTTDLNHIIYNYPSKLQSLLDAEANELRTIYLEARAARQRIQQVRNQRKAVRKECKAMEKSLALIKEEEIKEMENYIALYDKTLMTRWEKIRSSTQEDVVDSFIHDIKGKQKALDYLHTLASNRLRQLQSNAINPPTTEDSKPVSLALRRLSATGACRSSSGRWRSKHHERGMRAPATNSSQEANPSTALATPPFSLTPGPALTGTVHNGGTGRLSAPSSLGSASSSLLPTNTSPQPNVPLASTNTSPPSTDATERRSILQALFSDIQNHGTHDNLPINAVMPHLVSTNPTNAAQVVRGGGNDSQNIQSSGSAQNGNNIELYTLDDTP